MRVNDLSNVIWRKSSRSNTQGAECVELGSGGGLVGVRDSKNRGGGVLVFGGDALTRFLVAAKQGDFDLC
ncbi:DUF397 domain-containing protein [Goodfellowiella coeruleoviolacea]|uniref:DUF397 domain-containing protein n=1 Tax=Goodfellowiella coeruleoviolacea TaxID=334858 RepID=A0AAE3GL54_9PSEU|nr:DUF397 domain-containing protein [Goodfellowiella coeruleoviolacea]MCP2169545.1 protein of unknown function (DUF397) [Goodfellowiella coeruleoviolacea]